MRETLGTFTLIKNEAIWIAGHLDNALPIVDHMVFLDGNSTDGTLEALREAKDGPLGHKLTVVEDMDPIDLKDDYVRLFNIALKSLNTDLGWFLHPDMYIVPDGSVERFLGRSEGVVAGITKIRSVAGEPDGELKEIVKGRNKTWKNIYRLRNPDLGAHYAGWYGAWNEDVHFTAYDGDNDEIFYDGEHVGCEYSRYSFPVDETGITTIHFSDVRPYERRLSRMVTCLGNQKYQDKVIQKMAVSHPRVSLKDGLDPGDNMFEFKPYDGPCHLRRASVKA